jgi:hypothetical protein
LSVLRLMASGYPFVSSNFFSGEENWKESLTFLRLLTNFMVYSNLIKIRSLNDPFPVICLVLSLMYHIKKGRAIKVGIDKPTNLNSDGHWFHGMCVWNNYHTIWNPQLIKNYRNNFWMMMMNMVHYI